MLERAYGGLEARCLLPHVASKKQQGVEVLLLTTLVVCLPFIGARELERMTDPALSMLLKANNLVASSRAHFGGVRRS